MQYAAIYIHPKPWVNRRALVGIVVRSSDAGEVRVIREPRWMEKIREVACSSGEEPGIESCAEAERGVRSADQFLNSLEQLAENAQAPSIEEVLRQIPDRGTACRLSSVREAAADSIPDLFARCQASDSQTA